MTEERNLCPRCGKRIGGDVNYIHTCTPPQPEREWVETNNSACKILRQVHDMLALASYPPRKTWIGLTDAEMVDILAKTDWGELFWEAFCLTKIIEAKLKEKNNG